VAEYEYEPVPGLPERLPPGEVLLWQGAPRWQSLALHAFHARKVALYFLALLLLLLGWKLTGEAPLIAALGGALWLAALAAVAVGLLVLLAWATGRATLFTITNRRVVMRFGVAFPMAINLPFIQITTAGLRVYPDGTGDLPLTMSGLVNTSYMILWPYARPWRWSPPQPMLRAVPDAARVAEILAAALEAARPTTPPADTDV
jgi:hypothetical protein